MQNKSIVIQDNFCRWFKSRTFLSTFGGKWLYCMHLLFLLILLSFGLVSSNFEIWLQRMNYSVIYQWAGKTGHIWMVADWKRLPKVLILFSYFSLQNKCFKNTIVVETIQGPMWSSFSWTIRLIFFSFSHIEKELWKKRQKWWLIN